MPRFDVVVQCPIHSSFRVQQTAGMFDLPLTEQIRETFSAELPALDEPWSIGAIVGPSGSGKTTLARAAFGPYFHEPHAWPRAQAVIDGFGQATIKEITHTLTAVGFSSPPSWLKPYHVLSNGQRFRCDLARALMADAAPEGRGHVEKNAPLVVCDEFTSVVDRTAARIGAAAVSQAIRSGKLNRRFVAVTCHYDVLDWLEVDWLLDMARGELQRRRLRRPAIELHIHRCHSSAWELFKRHHYLNSELHNSAQCYLALWNGQPAAFGAVLNMLGRQGRKRISRLVVLPDYQGVGIGGRLLDCLARLYREQGNRMNITTSHPAMIAALKGSPRWLAVDCKPLGNPTKHPTAKTLKAVSRGRAIASFEFIGD